MVSALHESIVALFRERPEFAADLLALLQRPVPDHSSVEVSDADFTQLRPAEFRADLVLTFKDDDRPVFGVVLEVQLNKKEDKIYSWPVYGTTLRARLRCRTIVLVVTVSPDVAEWALQPIPLGGESVYHVAVVGPATIPQVTSAHDAAEDVELAVLSCVAHARNEAVAPHVALAACGPLSSLPDERAKLYWDLIRASLSEASRIALEDLMAAGNYQYQSDFAKKYVAEGEAKGKAEGILDILQARGLAVSAEQRSTIVGTTDLATLQKWLKRAVTCAAADDIFKD